MTVATYLEVPEFLNVGAINTNFNTALLNNMAANCFHFYLKEHVLREKNPYASNVKMLVPG